MLLFIVSLIGKVSALEGGHFASLSLPPAKLANASVAVSADLESTSPRRVEELFGGQPYCIEIYLLLYRNLSVTGEETPFRAPRKVKRRENGSAEFHCSPLI